MQPLRALFFITVLQAFTILNSDAEVFKVRLSSQPKTLDWNLATSGSEGAIIQNIMRGIPDLTKSSEWDSSSKILTLTLKLGVKWSDSKALKCQHFYDSFERLLNPGLNSPNASLLFDIEQARDYFLGKEKNFSSVGVRCDKDDRLVIKLKEPRSNFLSILTHWATFPLRKENLKLTLGNYLLADRPTLRLQKVDASTSGPATVQFSVVPDGSRALLDFEAGKLQYLLQVEDDLLNPSVIALEGLGFVDPLRVVALLHLNPTRAATISPERRRAIMSRIPLQLLIDSSPSVRVQSPSIIPQGILGGPESRSAKVFQVQGEQASAPTESLSLGYPNDALSKSIALMIQEKSAGLKIKIEPLPANDSGKYDLILSLFGLDYPDADQLLAAFLSQGTLDLFNFSSAELLQLIQKARATQDAAARGKLYAQAADFLQHRVAIVMPLFYRRRAFLLHPAFEHERGAEGSANLARIQPKKRPKKK